MLVIYTSCFEMFIFQTLILFLLIVALKCTIHNTKREIELLLHISVAYLYVEFHHCDYLNLFSLIIFEGKRLAKGYRGKKTISLSI